MGNEHTDAGVVGAARAFYESVGKVTIEVRREVPGHVANRLQAALWREAIHLVEQGVASVRDVDLAVSCGPGLRWAVMGPTMLFHLGGDDGGIAAFCERYSDTFHRWWGDLGGPRLDPPTVEMLTQGVLESAGTCSTDELAARRDAVLSAVIAVTRSR
jgi:carnitine 3-dehydrogenase